jgi:hypothetical protein
VFLENGPANNIEFGEIKILIAMVKVIYFFTHLVLDNKPFEFASIISPSTSEKIATTKMTRVIFFARNMVDECFD